MKKLFKKIKVMKKIKRYFKNYALAFLAIVMIAVIGVNVQIALEDQKDSSDVTLKNIEALSEEAANPWYLWPIYGTTKDEWSEEKPCTEGINLIIYYVEWEGIRIICHDGGSENCFIQICGE